MTEESRIEWDEGGCARLSGPLTFDSSPGLFHQVEARSENGHATHRIDLSGVSRADSAGLALLLEWQARAIAAGAAMTIENAPSGLMQLARLCEAVETLRLTGRQAGA